VAKDPANAELVKSLMKQWEGGWQAAKPPAQSVTSAEG
jgi:hypothetical protein